MDFRDAIVKYLAGRSDVSDVKFEMIEDTEEERLVREIMEEPQDEVRVRVTARLHVPVECISVRLTVGRDEA